MIGNDFNLKKKKKRSPFLLLELLIALSLILMCLVPLVRNPLYFFQSQRASLEAIELERLSFLAFYQAKEELYCGKNPSKVEKLELLLKGFPKKMITKRVELSIPKMEDKNLVVAEIIVLFQTGKKEKQFTYEVLLKNPSLSGP